MGRNHFSKHGGPYFINDGVSHHDDHDLNDNNKLDQNLFYGLTLLFLSLILTIGVTLVVLN